MENETADYVFVSGRDALDDGLVSAQAHEQAEAQRKILAWLEPSDYLASSSEFKKHQNAHTPGTGGWLTGTSQYQQWHDGDSHGTLWIKGVPGSGKSVIAADITRQLLEEENGKTPVLFFFFRHIISSNRSPISLLRDWLAQALPHSQLILSILRTHVDDHRALETVSHDELWRILLTGLKYMSKVYCVVDALDEMESGHELFLQKLVDLGKSNPASIKLMMTSRPVPYVEKKLAVSSVLQLRLEQHSIDQDITAYVNHRFNDVQLAALADRESANNFRASVVETFCQNGQGLFLYVKLMSDKIATVLTGGASYSEAMAILHSLPENLENMYTTMLNEHAKTHNVNRDMQVAVLQWATHASRPLRLIELAGAIHAYVSSSSMEFAEVKKLVRASCGPLLEIFEDETVQVIHHSFTEFLLDKKRSSRPQSGEIVPFPVITFGKSHRALALACLRILTDNGLKFNPDESSRPDYGEYRAGNSKPQPFLAYAEQNWAHHASLYDVEDLEFFAALDLWILQTDIPMNNNKTHCEDGYPKRYVDIHRFHLESTEAPEKPNVQSALTSAAYEGLCKYAQYLLANGHDVNGNGQGLSPISAASANGHLEIVQVLATHGADLDREGSRGMKPILYAASANHAAVVKFLLENGVHYKSSKTREEPPRGCVWGPRTIGDTALKYASRYGHVEALAELIPYTDSEDLNDCLHWAAERGHAKNVSLLLERFKVTENDKCCWKRPLYLAVSSLDVESVRALSEYGAGVGNGLGVQQFSTQSGERDTDLYNPIHALTDILEYPFPALASVTPESQKKRDRRADILDILLSAGADINGLNDKGHTPLFSAISKDRYSLIELFLTRGADASITDEEGNTVLQCGKSKSGITLSRNNIELLVRGGAQLNAHRKEDGKTALHIAIGAGEEATCMNLLAVGANPTLVDNSGNTILHEICKCPNHFWDARLETYFSFEILRDLVNKPNYLGQTCLHVCAAATSYSTESETLIEELIKAGAELEARNNEGSTVLLQALARSHSDTCLNTIILLLKLGSRIDARDNKGKTVLHKASRNSKNLDVFQMLVRSGADIRWTDFAGNTVLHEIVSLDPNDIREGGLEYIQYLIGQGLSPDARNHEGRTPLHNAVAIPIVFRYRCDRCPIISLLADKENGGNVNCKDYHGVRPIHLAATTSEDDFWQLINLGADATVRTAEGRSPLHVACRARQSNIVGMLLKIYSTIDQNLVNMTDNTGRTALHDACRSGKVESVQQLLKAGANLHINDKHGCTPLAACSEFPEEDACWTTVAVEGAKCGIRFKDPFRKVIENSSRYGELHHETVRIGEVVRTLLHAGAAQDDSRVEPSKRRAFDIAFRRALDSSCGPMVREMRFWLEQNPGEEDKTSIGIWSEPSFSECFLASNFLPDPRTIQHGRIHMNDFDKILHQHDEEVILKMIDHGLDLNPGAWTDSPIIASPLHSMANYGFSNLLKRIGSRAADMQDPKINAILDKMRQCSGDVVCPLLHTACDRQVYNMSVIKVLVDDLKLNVNIHHLDQRGHSWPYRHVQGSTALHILARGTEWWHPEAIAFLLQRCADPNAKNAKGETPLHIAFNPASDSLKTGRWQDLCVKELLLGGADPNILNDKNFSCLCTAVPNKEFVRMLLDNGANPSKGNPAPIFAAVHHQDTDLVRIFLEAGAESNAIMVRPQLQPTKPTRAAASGPFPGCAEYVLLHAACRYTDVPHHWLLPSEAKWQELVEILLSHGADPTLEAKDGESILQYVCQEGGILAPFLKLTDLNWEIRDSRGRTPLLIAAEARRPSVNRHSARQNVIQLVHSGVQRNVSNYEGQNILHSLIINKCGKLVPELMQSFDDIRSLAIKKDKKGFAPIHLSLRYRNIMVTRALMKEGADIAEADPGGNTALHHLASGLLDGWDQHANFEVSNDKHLSGGPDLNAASSACLPLLKWDVAATNEMFNECLSHGMDLNAKNLDGEPPLFHFLASTVSYGSKERCFDKFDLFAEADVFARDNRGRTALHIVAARRERNGSSTDTIDLFKKLLELGLDPLAEDERMMTPLDVAAANQNKSILGLFARTK